MIHFLCDCYHLTYIRWMLVKLHCPMATFPRFLKNLTATDIQSTYNLSCIPLWHILCNNLSDNGGVAINQAVLWLITAGCIITIRSKKNTPKVGDGYLFSATMILNNWYNANYSSNFCFLLQSGWLILYLK